jgi:hypothetical protein
VIVDLGILDDALGRAPRVEVIAGRVAAAIVVITVSLELGAIASLPWVTAPFIGLPGEFMVSFS